MIEILFGESEAGSMKCAKSRKKIEKANDGPTAIFGNPDLLPERKDWIPIYGTSAEVVCLCGLLNVGDIREDFEGEYRTELILDMYTQSGWETGEDYIRELREEIEQRKKEYKRLWEFIEAGEELRIWYSEAPYSLCGFYWLCQELYHVENKISVVKLPAYRVLEDKASVGIADREKKNSLADNVEKNAKNIIVEYQNWGEVMPEEMSSFLTVEKTLSKNEIHMFGQKWTELKEDNSPLRAVINGELVGVKEDFYDAFILKEITKEPIREARLIGNLLGKYRLSVSDWWYAKRIEAMIQDGRIAIVEDCEQKYRRTIARRC